jgi:hypothetical protein
MAPAREWVLKRPKLPLSRYQTGVSMFSHPHQHLTEPVSRGYGRIGGYALIVVIAALLLLALLTNPVLPF